MDAQYIYSGHHFMMQVDEITRLCILILQSPICQLHLNKSGRKKDKINYSKTK